MKTFDEFKTDLGTLRTDLNATTYRVEKVQELLSDLVEKLDGIYDQSVSNKDQAVDLAARQLAALTRLGALGNLDLQHLGIDQVFRGHTKAAGGHLLDLRTLDGAVARRVFTAFTRVGTRIVLITAPY